MLYCSLFLPYINYCCEICGNTFATNVECITVVQKRVVRLVCSARRLDHTNPLFKQLGILKFVDLVKYKTSIIMFNAYHNELPDSLQIMFNLYVQLYDTRQKSTFTVHRAHTNVKSMCISIYGVKLWKSLHVNMTSCICLHVFKNKCMLNIISTYYIWHSLYKIKRNNFVYCAYYVVLESTLV